MLQERRGGRWRIAPVGWIAVGALGAIGLVCTTATAQRAVSPGVPGGAAYVIRDLLDSRTLREAHAEILDAPVLPGSVMKAVTLVAALESGSLKLGETHLCRRVVTVEGTKYVCTHPDLKRPLTLAEALAHSCNDFFLSLASRLPRSSVNATRQAVGLPPLAEGIPLAPALVGLDGPRVTPRALLGALARLAGAGRDGAIPMHADTRRVLLEGLRGAATYGTASALHARGISALAKTGTAPMPRGGSMGLVVVLVPAVRPTRGVVVVAPGAAGLDAAAIAADLLADVTPRPAVRLGRTSSSGQPRVEEVELDDYVAQVVAGEGQPSAGDAAQQALAITARSYVLGNLGRHRDEGFDVCDSTHCQVVRSATGLTRRAASATSGRVLLHEGKIAPVFHSAWCGGHPERASDVWPGAAGSVPIPVADEACAGEPGWTSDVRASDIERALRTAGLRGDRLTDMRVIQRTRSGRVGRVRLEGFSPGEMGGEAFRTAVGRTLGWQLLKSTLFEVHRTSGGYRFVGKGFGHGVGLCVLGAGRRAERGATVESILRFYFPNDSLGEVPRREEIALSLPASDESERDVLMTLIRASRDEIATRVGVDVPPIIRITVHPTVEGFSRATGQPWFVSGATRGVQIDFIPLTFLRRQGPLRRVVRHELAHLLLDARLAQRPMWVREGAARVFSAEPATPGAPPSRLGSCPTDTELRHATSAEALRDAYERAEACFRSALASGTPWYDVR